MPDLKSTVERGPSFDIHVIGGEDARCKFDLRMPLRFLRFYTPPGTAFVDSPLVQRRSHWSAGFGFSWLLRHCSSMVEVPD
jgi:hypothetical protein